MKVNFYNNEHDFRVLFYAHKGLTTNAIARLTGLAPCQVQYRIGAGHAVGARAAYRNGEEESAFAVISAVADKAVEKYTMTLLAREVPGPKSAFKQPRKIIQLPVRHQHQRRHKKAS